MTTARLTDHARERCEQMGVRTKRVKRIVRNPDLTRPSRGHTIAVCDDEPDIAVVYCDDGEVPVVITVVPRTEEIYER